MRRSMRAVTLAVAVVAVSVSVFAAEETGEKPQPVKVPIPPYRTLSARDAYRAAARGIQAPVRFRDTFREAFTVPTSLRQIELGGRTYLVTVAFRTSTDLVCLVPRSSLQALRVLFGPAGGPNIALGTGQQLVVEGRLLGERRGQKYVMVDAISTGSTIRTSTRRELRVYLPGKPTPAVLTGTGTETLRFPCTHKEDQMEALTVRVEPKSPADAAAAAARLAGEMEGLGGPKSYGDYEPGTVYQRARERRRWNVQFTDRIIRIRRGADLPSGLAAVRLPRGNRTVRVPVAYAFETSQHVQCLVPNVWPTMVQQAERVLVGETVRVLGSTLPDAEAVVVDYMGFPLEGELTGRTGTWWVTLELGEDGARRAFWDVGRYAFPDLPCQYARGFEPVRVVMEEYRLLQTR